MLTYTYVCMYVYADINECADPRSCGYNQMCSNTAGSYKCECLTGYEPDDSYRGLISDDSYYHYNGTYVITN